MKSNTSSNGNGKIVHEIDVTVSDTIYKFQGYK